MNVQNNILTSATQLFIQYGMRSVTMDDIAREAGVSKKTIYQHFKDKDQVVVDSVKLHFETHIDEIKKSLEDFSEPLQRLISISSCIMHQMDAANPVLLFDIKKYYPKAYAVLSSFKSWLFDRMVSILDEGKQSEVFREDIDPQVMATTRLYQVESVFDTEIYPRDRFNFMVVQEQLYKLFIQGILTKKGRKLLNTNSYEI